MRDKLMPWVILLLLGIIGYLSMERWWAYVVQLWELLGKYGVVVQSLAALLGIVGMVLTVMKGYFRLFAPAEGVDGGESSTPRYNASLEGGGTIAQGENINVLGDNAVQTQAPVHGDVMGAGAKKNVTTINHYKPPLSREDVARARARYLDMLAQRCNVLPLAALGGQEGMGEEVKLDEVYVALDTTSRVRLTEEEKKNSRVEDRVLTALEAATQERRLVLLGDPGSGKSTFVRQLVAGVARACESFDPSTGSGHRKLKNSRHRLPSLSRYGEGWEAGLLPVFVVLRDLAPGLEALTLNGSTEENRKALLGAIWAQWRADLESLGAEGFEEGLRDALQDGSVLLIFDGLDEVASAWRERVRWAVSALIQSYPQTRRVIVTCRIRSYEGNAKLPGFAQHTLAPFTGEQIQGFVGLWYRAQTGLGRMDQATAQERADDLQRAALVDKLGELAENPMLLTTMTLIHQEQVGLPHERVRLYALAVELLIRRWQKHKKTQLSPPLETFLEDKHRLQEIMEHLGYQAHQTQSQGDSVADLRRRDLFALLENSGYFPNAALVDEFLDYVDQRAGLLVGRGGHQASGKPQLYTFLHRTFQEYLAGCYMVRGSERKVRGKYRAHLSEGDYWQLPALLGVEEVFYRQADGEKVLELAYKLCPAKPPNDQAAWRGVLWSALMAVLVGGEKIKRYAKEPDGDPKYVERLLKRLVELMEDNHLPPIERAEAGRVLAQLGDPRRKVLTVEQMQFCHVPAGPFWMGAPDDAEHARNNERPLHQVNIPYDYWISRHPITNAQFEQFVKARGYKKQTFFREAKLHGVWKDGKVKGWNDSEWRSRPYDYGSPFNLPNHPVVGVTFYEARAFARWLGEQWGCRVELPTEVEWEKAARGGEMIPENPLICTASQLNDPAFLASLPAPALKPNPLPQRHFPWGNQADPTRANYDDTGIGSTNAVGCFSQGESPYGCQEMSGNVWEWVQSLDKAYPYDPEYQRETLHLRSDHVSIIIRSSNFSADKIRASFFFRYWHHPNIRYFSGGFRVFRPYPSELCSL
ncbi:MAG: SUMF1/EgtB/PvdO family nonheme iron enzyme [Ardenticatenaceae bacterium]